MCRWWLHRSHWVEGVHLRYRAFTGKANVWIHQTAWKIPYTKPGSDIPGPGWELSIVEIGREAFWWQICANQMSTSMGSCSVGIARDLQQWFVPVSQR